MNFQGPPRETVTKHTVIELDPAGQQLLHHIMRHGAVLEMLKKELHLRIIRKASILTIETEMGWMQVDRQRRTSLRVFLEDMRR